MLVDTRVAATHTPRVFSNVAGPGSPDDVLVELAYLKSYGTRRNRRVSHTARLLPVPPFQLPLHCPFWTLGALDFGTKYIIDHSNSSYCRPTPVSTSLLCYRLHAVLFTPH
eukprot:365943-Chlamydomonas_euryale.AAC.6